MIQQLLERHKGEMDRRSPRYRINRVLYEETAEILGREEALGGVFVPYLRALEEERERHLRYHYLWGVEMGRGGKPGVCPEAWTPPPEENGEFCRLARDAGERAREQGEEIVLLWRMFCRAERRCRDYEAAYLCALGVSAGKEEQRPAPK